MSTRHPTGWRLADCIWLYGWPDAAYPAAQEDAAALAERLRAGVELLALPHNASAVSPVVTLSAGVATTVPEEGISPNALLAAADTAMYQAKREGRNRVSRA